MPPTAPIASFNIPNPSCLRPPLPIALAFVTVFFAFNTVPSNAPGLEMHLRI